jgi:hypothetical protein
MDLLLLSGEELALRWALEQIHRMWDPCAHEGRGSQADPSAAMAELDYLGYLTLQSKLGGLSAC